MIGLFAQETKQTVMILFSRSVCQLVCIYPPLRKVRKVKKAGSRIADREGRTGKIRHGGEWGQRTVSEVLQKRSRWRQDTWLSVRASQAGGVFVLPPSLLLSCSNAASNILWFLYDNMQAYTHQEVMYPVVYQSWKRCSWIWKKKKRWHGKESRSIHVTTHYSL